jgi:polar amino acid transport system substrate-binding protein
MRLRGIGTAAAVTGAALALAGCGATIPSDPEGTSDRVADGALHVGAVAADDWVVADGDGDPTGREVELVDAYAEHTGAEIEWSTGGEQRLVEALEAGDLDLVIGGIRPDTPWSDRTSTTQPYTLEAADGSREELVALARMGENRFVLDLDRFFQERDDAR